MCDVRPDEFSALGHNRAMSRVQHRVIRGAVSGYVEADGVGGVPWGVDDLHWGRTVGYGKELAVCEVVEEPGYDSHIRVCVGWERELVDARRLE